MTTGSRSQAAGTAPCPHCSPGGTLPTHRHRARVPSPSCQPAHQGRDPFVAPPVGLHSMPMAREAFSGLSFPLCPSLSMQDAHTKEEAYVWFGGKQLLDASISRHLSNLSHPFIPVRGGGVKPLSKPGLFLEGCTARDTLSLAKVRGHQMVLTFLSKAPCRARGWSGVRGGSREGRKEFVCVCLASCPRLGLEFI